MLTELQSHCLCFLASSLFVVALYLIPKGVRSLPRDATKHIMYRVLASNLVTWLGLVFLYYYFYEHRDNSILQNLTFNESIGFQLSNLLDSLSVVTILMCIFYLGPLVANIWMLYLRRYYHISGKGNMLLLSQEAQSKNSYWHMINQSYTEALLYIKSRPDICTRNIISAPVTEEIVYRAFIIVSQYLSVPMDVPVEKLQVFAWRCCSWCVAYFALAHLHHFSSRIHEGAPWKQALIETTIQLTYTSVFGLIAALLLVRTGNLMAPILSHIICNVIQLPDVSFYEQTGRGYMSALYPFRHILTVIHIGGLILFAYLLFPMTETLSRESIYWVGRGRYGRM